MRQGRLFLIGRHPVHDASVIADPRSRIRAALIAVESNTTPVLIKPQLQFQASKCSFLKSHTRPISPKPLSPQDAPPLHSTLHHPHHRHLPPSPSEARRPRAYNLEVPQRRQHQCALRRRESLRRRVQTERRYRNPQRQLLQRRLLQLGFMVNAVHQRRQRNPHCHHHRARGPVPAAAQEEAHRSYPGRARYEGRYAEQDRHCDERWRCVGCPYVISFRSHLTFCAMQM